MHTDSSSEITARPQPTEEEIRFILDAIAEYLTVEVRRSDVQSAWSGLRPLAVDPNAKDTASASRDHIVTQDPDGLITVTGLCPLRCTRDGSDVLWRGVSPLCISMPSGREAISGTYFGAVVSTSKLQEFSSPASLIVLGHGASQPDIPQNKRGMRML